MTPLTTQQLLTLAYNMFRSPSESGANGTAIYVLTVPALTGSGVTVGVNQLDFGQNAVYANQLVAQANQYAAANPQLGLTQLPTAKDDPFTVALTAKLDANGTNASTIETAASNPTLTAFLSSSAGHSWVDQASGQYTGQVVNALTSNLSSNLAGQQILSDPEMFSLVLEVRNNAGNVVALAKLLNNGSATFPDGTTLTLTPDQLSGATPLTLSDLQGILVHQYSDPTSSQALKVSGQFTTDAAATASGFQAGTLVTPPAGFISGGKVITGSVDDPLSLDALAAAALGNTQLASSTPVGGQAEAVSAQWQDALAGDTGQFNGYQSLPSGDVVVHSSAGNDYVLHLDGSVTKFSGTTDGSVVNANGTLTVFSSPGAFTWDPSSGTISGSDPGSTAVSATVNGPSGPETVTLLGLGGTSPFALISNDNSSVTASAVSSNVTRVAPTSVASARCKASPARKPS
jgi:hypothetical protein